MKIKISEEQAKRLGVINENTDPLSQFEQFCKIKIQEINNMYGKVINLSVAEIVNNEIDMSTILESLSNISHSLHTANKKAYSYIETISGDNLDLRIDNAYEAVSDKLTALELIVMELEGLQDKVEEHRLTSNFKDVKPINIVSNS